MENTDIKSDKVIKFIVGLFAFGYYLLVINMLNITAPGFGNPYLQLSEAIAPTVQCEAPNGLADILRCVGRSEEEIEKLLELK